MHKILIVDDETSIRESLQGVLADEGYETATVASGEECLKLLRREHTYEVVLLDIWPVSYTHLDVYKRQGYTQQ